MTTVQKFNCEKCLKDYHNECLNPKTCLCAENKHGEPLFDLDEEAKKALKSWTLDYVKKSAREMPLSERLDVNSVSQVVNYLKKEFVFKTLDDTWEIYFYKDGVYIENAEVLIASLCNEIIPDCSKITYNQIIWLIQSSTFTPRSEFNKDLSKIVLENGILDLETLELSDFDPNFLTTVKLPIEYDPKARCPKFIKFLKDCLNPQDIITVIEECSNILTTNRKNFEVSVMWIGDGANGKSTLLKILRGVIGGSNCSNVSIHSMQSQRFSISQLNGKLANIHADISNRELNNLGIFKQIISGEPIPAEKKNKDPFTLISFAKHFFSANEMPDIKDNSDGAFRRIYVTKWENQFLSGTNCIEDLDKIILNEEKNAIFNLLIQNYRTLIRNNGFRHKQSIAQVRETIKRESDKLREFVEDCLIIDPNGQIPNHIMYETYVKFCTEKTYDVYSQQKFSVNLPSYQINKKPIWLDGKTTKVWRARFNKENEWLSGQVKGLDNYV